MGLHAIDRWFRGGFFGVDIFFVLSAFLITSLVIEGVGSRGSRYDFVAFYWRRFFRLGPALFVWLLLVAAPASLAVHEGAAIVRGTLVSLLYVGDIYIALGVPLGRAYLHVWSLAIEEQFYAIWPAVLVFLVLPMSVFTKRVVLSVSVAVAAVLYAVSTVLWTGTYFLPPGHLVPIAVGCLSAILFVYGVPDPLRRVAGSGPAKIVCLCLLPVVFVLYRPVPWQANLAVQGAVSGATGILILGVILDRSGLASSLLGSAPFVWIGARSYGLYLYHRTLMVLIPGLLPGLRGRLAIPAVLVVSLAMAWASFGLIERPVQRLGKRWLAARTGGSGGLQRLMAPPPDA